MSVRAPSQQTSALSSRLYDVLGIGLTARPREPPAAVYTSAGALIGYAEAAATEAEPLYVFVQPESLKGVRVHPPFRVESGNDTSSGTLAAGLAHVLSGALGR
jgi:hypothetical protein